jgi:hypothetical protein
LADILRLIRIQIKPHPKNMKQRYALLTLVAILAGPVTKAATLMTDGFNDWNYTSGKWYMYDNQVRHPGDTNDKQILYKSNISASTTTTPAYVKLFVKNYNYTTTPVGETKARTFFYSTAIMETNWNQVEKNWSGYGPGSYFHGQLRIGSVLGVARYPIGTGYGFWLKPVDGTWPPEIDIVEYSYGSGTTAKQGYHYNSRIDYTHQHDGVNTVLPNLTDWHTYGVKYKTDRIEFYLDSVWKQTLMATSGNDIYITARKMKMMLSTSAGINQSWFGQSSWPQNTGAIGEMHVNYATVETIP